MVGDLSTFLGDAEAKKSWLAKGELTNGWDLSDATGERERFSSGEREGGRLSAL